MTAVKAGNKGVYKTTLTDLVDNLAKAQYDGQLNQKLRQMSRPSLLIVDESGYLPQPKEGTNLLFQPVIARSDLLLDTSVGLPLSAEPKRRRGRPPKSKKVGLVYNSG